MKVSRLHLAYPAPVKELQGMIRTSGEGSRARAIEPVGDGFRVTLTSGGGGVCSAAGVACMVDEVPTLPAPGPVPGKRGRP